MSLLTQNLLQRENNNRQTSQYVKQTMQINNDVDNVIDSFQLYCNIIITNATENQNYFNNFGKLYSTLALLGDKQKGFTSGDLN